MNKTQQINELKKTIDRAVIARDTTKDDQEYEALKVIVLELKDELSDMGGK